MRQLIAASLFLAASNALGTVFTVNTIDNDGPGSLRQAIIDANSTPYPPHRIEFTGQFPLEGMVELFRPLPMLTVPVEIDGAGRSPIVLPFDASNSFTLLHTREALTIRDATLRQGRADGRGGCIRGENATGDSPLVIDSVIFAGCTAVVNDGAQTARGGAVAWESTGLVTIKGSIFQDNAALSVSGDAATGGAVYGKGSLLVERSYFFGNSVSGSGLFGGAIGIQSFLSGSVDVSGSVFVGNRAEPIAALSVHGMGGAVGIDCSTCDVRIQRNYFGHNRAVHAGALFVRGNDSMDAASLVLHNVTFANNHASDSGGGLFTTGARMDARHITFHDNGAAVGSHVAVSSSSIAEWSNTVLGEVAAGAGAGCSVGAIAEMTAGNYMAPGGGCHVSIPGIIPVTDLQTLGVDDGAAMPVVVFAPSSAVVDGGDADRCLIEDARGRPRPQDGNGDDVQRCDAGAYELPGIRLFTDGFED